VSSRYGKVAGSREKEVWAAAKTYWSAVSEGDGRRNECRAAAPAWYSSDWQGNNTLLTKVLVIWWKIRKRNCY